MATRQEILNKYGITPGVAPKGATSAGAQKPPSSSAANDILAKYGMTRTDKGYGTIAPSAPTPAPTPVTPPTLPTPTVNNDGSKTYKFASGHVVTQDPQTQGILAQLPSAYVTTLQEKFRDPMVNAIGDLVSRSKDWWDAVTNPTKSKLDVGVASVRALVGGVNTAFAPVSLGLEEAAKAPVIGAPFVAINYLFGKAGEAGGWASDHVVDALPLSDTTKAKVRPAAAELSGLLTQIALGEIAAKGLHLADQKIASLRGEISTNIQTDAAATKTRTDIIHSEGMDVNRAIESGDVPRESVYQHGDTLTPNYATGRAQDIASKLDAFQPGLGETFQAGVDLGNVTMKQLIDHGVQILDKASQGSAFVPVIARPREIKPGEPIDTTPVEQQPVKPAQHSYEDVLTTTPEEFITETKKINDLLTSPIDASISAEIAGLSPNEASAFGRTLVERLNEELKTTLDENKDLLAMPDNVQLLNFPIPDGRPAQFDNGRIQISIPNLMKDIKDLATGAELEIHPGGPFTQIFKRLPKESIDQLSARYIKEVVAHEHAHAETMTIRDKETALQFKEEALAARRGGNEKLFVEKQAELAKHMQMIEDKANAHLAANRVSIEQKLFGGKRNPAPMRVLGIREPAKLNVSERAMLKSRIEAMQTGAEAGKKAGVKEGIKTGDQKVARGTNFFKTKAEDAARKSKLDLLKERIKGRFQKKDIVTRYDKVLESINNKTALIKDQKALLIDYAQLVPRDVRGDFLKAINNAKNGKDFNNILDRMRKVSDRKNRKNIKGQILTEIAATKIKKRNGVPQSKMDATANTFFSDRQKLQETFKAARKAEIDAKAGVNATPAEKRAIGATVPSVFDRARAEIIRNVNDWQLQQKDRAVPSPLSAELFAKNQVLSTIGLDDMTAQQLAQVLATVKEVKELGMTKLALERFNRETAVQRTSEAVIGVLKGKELPPGAGEAIDRSWETTSKLGIVKNFFSLEQKGIEDILDTVSKNDKTSGPNKSFLNQWMMGLIRDSQSREFIGNKLREVKVNKMFEDVYGKQKPRAVLKELHDINKEVTIDGVKMADGTTRSLKLSRGEAMQYEAHYRDPLNHDTFVNGLNFSEDTLGKMRSIMTENDKKMVDAIFGYYSEYHGRIDATYVKDTSVHLPKNELYAGPLTRDVSGSVFPESSLLAQEQMKFASVRNGSLIGRVESELAIKPVGLFENLMHHAAQMEHYIAWEDSMYQMRRVFSDPQVRITLRRYHGKDAMTKIDNYLNDQARGGIEAGKRNAFLDVLRTNASRHLLGLPNVKIPIKQLAGIASYGMELPMKDFTFGVANFWKSPIDNAKFLYDNSPYFQERIGKGYGRDIKSAMEQGYDQKIAKAKTISEYLFLGIRGMDAVTVMMGGHAAYTAEFARLSKAGVDPARARHDALQYAQKVTERVQEGGSLHEQSEFQRGGSVAQLLTMFISQPNKMYRETLSGFRNIKEGRGTKAENIRRIVWSWFLAQYTYNIVANALLPQQYQDSPGKLAAETAILGPFSGITLVGPVLQTMADHAFGKQKFGYSGSAVTGSVDSGLKAIDDATKGDWVNSTAFITDTLGWLGGVPTTMVTNPIRANHKANKKGASF